MSVQAWMVKAWPMVEWYLPDATDRWPALWHVQTQVRDGSDRPGRRFGDTVWIGVVNGKSVGLAWDWVELRPGVVMMADPNSVITNLRFLTPQRHYQEHAVAMVSLNRLTHHLPWQDTVVAVLAAETQRIETARARQGVVPLYNDAYVATESRRLSGPHTRAAA